MAKSLVNIKRCVCFGLKGALHFMLAEKVHGMGHLLLPVIQLHAGTWRTLPVFSCFCVFKWQTNPN